MDPIDPREFGRLEASVESMGREIGEMKTTLNSVNSTLQSMQQTMHEARGGSKVAQWLLAAPGGAALVAWLSQHWNSAPK